MNLSSAYFDAIRIPPRVTPEGLARQICRDADIDVELIRSGPLYGRRPFDLFRRKIRCRVAKGIRNAGYPFATTAAWFSDVTPATVRDYLLEPDGENSNA
jgi:hypothetical protein